MSDIQQMEMLSTLTIMAAIIAILLALNICKKRISKVIVSIVILAVAAYALMRAGLLNNIEIWYNW